MSAPVAGAAAASGGSPMRTLVRHFIAQFASFEAVSPSGEAKQAVIAVVSLLAAPGYLMAVVTVRGGLRMAMALAGRVPPEHWLWRQEWTLFVVSLAAVAVLAAVQWRSFLLCGRDFRILGALPVPRRTVTVAKLASLALIVGLVHLAANALPGLILPMACPLGYLRPALALQLALLLQTVFVFASVVAAQGALPELLPRSLVARASSLAQFTILLGAAFVFLWSSALSRLAFLVRDDVQHPVNVLVPIVWFRALYLRLAGVHGAQLDLWALQAVLATALATALAVRCCLAGYRDEAAPAAEAPRLRLPRLPLPRLLAPRAPVASAVATFARRAVSGSPDVALVARGWFAVGLALTLAGLGALALRRMGRDAPIVPSSPLFAPAVVLPFFALVGLRLAAVFPACLEANWIFRLTETPRSSDYAAGVRAAVMRIAVWPLLAVLGVGYAVLWGPLRAAALAVLALAIARVTAEWLFLGFGKVPFTCTYQPGKANLRVSWPKHAAVFLLYCAVLPALVERLLGSPGAYVTALVLLVAAREALVALGRRSLARTGRLSFEDRAPAAVTSLDLNA